MAQIEVLEKVERLRLGAGEIVPLVLPPEAVEVGVEIFPRQVALIAGALDVVVRLQGMPKCSQMLSASGRFAVPEKILKRSSCTSSWLHASDHRTIKAAAI